MAFGILQHWPLDFCASFANFYASQNCLHLGGRAGLLPAVQILPWLHQAEADPEAQKCLES
jgi:hypothetical protein